MVVVKATIEKGIMSITEMIAMPPLLDENHAVRGTSLTIHVKEHLTSSFI